jgi:hypothetical protein
MVVSCRRSFQVLNNHLAAIGTKRIETTLSHIHRNTLVVQIRQLRRIVTGADLRCSHAVMQSYSYNLRVRLDAKNF